jgi:DNA-binding response OmpR family regulator
MSAASTLRTPDTADILIVGAGRESVFEGTNLAAYFAANAFKALQRLDVDTYALVVMDLELPDTNGMELLQHIRRKSSVPTLVLGPPGRSDLSKAPSSLHPFGPS